MKNKKSTLSSVASATVNGLNPVVNLRQVTDPGILDQQELFQEAKRQCQPVGSTPLNAERFIKDTTARTHGLKSETVQSALEKEIELGDLCKGANPQGKAKEVVVAYEYNKMRHGDTSGVVNAPRYNSPSVKDVRISPDTASKRDIIFKVDIGNDRVILAEGGQVKTGAAEYIADSLSEMAKKEGYGKTAILDAKFVNSDGSPKIAPDAFTPEQARKIQEGGIRLRGVKDLDSRGDNLLKNINGYKEDELDPVTQHKIQQLQNDIANAYKGRAVAGRMAGNAAIAFAAAAILSIVIQYSTNKRVDIQPVLQSGGQAAAYGGTGALADAALYKIGTHMGKTAQQAKAFAQQGVTVGFCLVAAAADTISEFKSYKEGDIALADAAMGSSFKIALDILPIITAPLGVFGVPICIGAQIGGRWGISKLRAADKRLDAEIEAELQKSRLMDERIVRLENMYDEADSLFDGLGLTCKPQLRIVN